MPEYTCIKEAGRRENHPLIHCDISHLFSSGLLRRRLMCALHKKGRPEPHQVAQRGEFRYMEGEICQYWSPFVRILYELASKMIANGCYWTDDRLTGRAIDPETGKTGLFGISFPEGMIQDPYHQIDGGPGTYALILCGSSSVGATMTPPMKKGVRNRIRLHKRANSGTWIWKYGITGVGSSEFCMKWALK